ATAPRSRRTASFTRSPSRSSARVPSSARGAASWRPRRRCRRWRRRRTEGRERRDGAGGGGRGGGGGGEGGRGSPPSPPPPPPSPQPRLPAKARQTTSPRLPLGTPHRLCLRHFLALQPLRPFLAFLLPLPSPRHLRATPVLTRRRAGRRTGEAT